MEQLVALAQQWLTRKFEYEADAFAVSQVREMSPAYFRKEPCIMAKRDSLTVAESESGRRPGAGLGENIHGKQVKSQPGPPLVCLEQHAPESYRAPSRHSLPRSKALEKGVATAASSARAGWKRERTTPRYILYFFRCGERKARGALVEIIHKVSAK